MIGIGRLAAWTDRRLLRYSKRRSRAQIYPWMGEAIAEHVHGAARVLNIGAGGDVEAVLRDAGVTLESVDIDPDRAPDIVASIEQLDMIADGSVDAVFCMEVLEHVADPTRAITELDRILTPGGVVVGSTPFMLGIHDAPHDYFRYTRHGLERLFAGFDTLKLKERNRYFEAVGVLLLRPLADRDASRRRRARQAAPLLLGMQPVLHLLDRALPIPGSTTGYFFIFRKPLAADAPLPRVGAAPE